MSEVRTVPFVSIITQVIKDISPRKLAAAIGSFFILAILAFAYMSKITEKDMAILYADLDIDSSNKVIAELENKKVPYDVVGDGSIIKVPRAQLNQLRIALAQSGLPNNGSIIGYEIFDKEDNISTTNFSQNIKMVRALEGEISRTISSFDQIEKARVHLVLPQREIFSKDKAEPKASVVLKLKRNKKLSKSEIDSISHLVVTSVPSLEMNNVTIVDTQGRSLKLGSTEDDMDLSNMQNEEYRIAYENRLKYIIERLLEQSLGAGKVIAQVTAKLNFDRIVTNSEIYDPDSAVARSVQSIDELEKTPVKGENNLDVSVSNNLPPVNGDDTSNQNFAIVEKSDQITNYEISKTIKNHISEAGVLERLSIGILVDGTYKLDSTTNSMDYIPRSREEIEKIINLVKVAVGFDQDRDDKIEVVNMQFNADDSMNNDEGSNWIQEELPQLLQTFVFAVVFLLVLITVIRPITLKAFEISQNKNNSSDASAAAIDDKRGVQSSAEPHDTEKEEHLDTEINKLNHFIESYPEEMVNILRKWINENKS